MIEIRQYNDSLKSAWNEFVANSKNGTFLFDRNFMEYHKDRFCDASLMFYKEDKLIALLPANIDNHVLYSHQGLTYGGIVLNRHATTIDVLAIFEVLHKYAQEQNIKRIVYKPTPYIYHVVPAQEDLYALFKQEQAKLVARNISTTIDMQNRIPFRSIRKAGVKKALKEGLLVGISTDITGFWNVMTENLKNKYGTTPVHNLEEIKLLISRFPENIQLYAAHKNQECVGGVLLFNTQQVCHSQYISANEYGKEFGALDAVFDNIINNLHPNIRYFDFGQSTEDYGKYLNEGLIYQKEGFGGRGVCYDCYEYEI